MASKTVNMVQIKDYFGYDNLARFRKDWGEMDENDKAEIRALVAAELDAGRS